MIVIDVGAAAYGGDFSIPYLVEAFHPKTLYAFDPHDPMGGARMEEETSVFTNPVGVGCAAWTRDGEIGFWSDRLGSMVMDDPNLPQVPCFDLARFIKELPEDEIVLKLDCESAEYDLLDHLIRQKVDVRLKLVWVEFHNFGVDNPQARRRAIERSISCPLEEWRH